MPHTYINIYEPKTPTYPLTYRCSSLTSLDILLGFAA